MSLNITKEVATLEQMTVGPLHDRYIELFEEPDGDQVQFDVAVLNPTFFGGELALMVTEGEAFILGRTDVRKEAGEPAMWTPDPGRRNIVPAMIALRRRGHDST